MTGVRENVEAVRQRMSKACARAGRDTRDVKLIGVTKTVSAERVREAIEAGIRDIGENYVQEARSKIGAIGFKDIRWHMIGHIQSNKVKYIPELFDWVHTIDRVEILDRLDRYGKPMNVLFEVNCAGEATKTGTDVSGLRKLLEKTSSLTNLTPAGLMTMPPFEDDPEKSRVYFRTLKSMLSDMNAEFNLGMKELSMGMSSDFEVAIEEGATMVRVGTALFGERV
ncbi:MAG: YggS family pyridoxal phosphate-dependent enzyme [Syntrophorhabdaceae bacterium]